MPMKLSVRFAQQRQNVIETCRVRAATDPKGAKEAYDKHMAKIVTQFRGTPYRDSETNKQMVRFPDNSAARLIGNGILKEE